MINFVIFILAFCLCGCNALKAAKLPPTTSASYDMRSDIVRAIDSLQKIHDPQCKNYDITNARIVGSRDMAVLEEWNVLACGKITIYDIKITYSDYGGKTFNVTRREE